MKIYTLKLKTASTTNYSLYDGTTLVSDADLTTLFATEGEAYFTIDLNSLTPTNLTSLTIVNSSDTAVMTNTGLTLVDGKNFKGEWGNSATSFTSFTQLSAYGLDESQLSALVSKMGEGKIKTYEVSTSVDTNINLSEYMSQGEIAMFHCSSNSRIHRIGLGSDTNRYIAWATSRSNYACVLWVYPWPLIFTINQNGAREMYFLDTVTYPFSSKGYLMEKSDIADNLSTNDDKKALSAKQGRNLNNNIGDLSTLTTTAKTSTVAAINELVGSIGDISTALQTLTSGTGATGA